MPLKWQREMSGAEQVSAMKLSIRIATFLQSNLYWIYENFQKHTARAGDRLYSCLLFRAPLLGAISP
jgi:hypothetical protein